MDVGSSLNKVISEGKKDKANELYEFIEENCLECYKTPKFENIKNDGSLQFKNANWKIINPIFYANYKYT